MYSYYPNTSLNKNDIDPIGKGVSQNKRVVLAGFAGRSDCGVALVCGVLESEQQGSA